MPKKVNGSVLVVGGGIAGMQAALDLADSGYYVHLVEKSPGKVAGNWWCNGSVGQDIPHQ